jgi:hypothetical protein
MGGHNGIKGQMLANSASGQGLSNLYNTGAQGIGNTLTPALTAEATNPTGYTPTEMGAQTTAAEQTAGGSNANSTGGALLRAMRTRNAGAAPAAIAEGNRQSGQELSQINAGIQTNNANLKQKQRQAGLSGLQGLYGENIGAGLGNLNASTGALNDAGNLKNFWQDLLMQGVKTAGEVASAGMAG